MGGRRLLVHSGRRNRCRGAWVFGLSGLDLWERMHFQHRHVLSEANRSNKCVFSVQTVQGLWWGWGWRGIGGLALRCKKRERLAAPVGGINLLAYESGSHGVFTTKVQPLVTEADLPSSLVSVVGVVVRGVLDSQPPPLHLLGRISRSASPLQSGRTWRSNSSELGFTSLLFLYLYTHFPFSDGGQQTQQSAAARKKKPNKQTTIRSAETL